MVEPAALAEIAPLVYIVADDEAVRSALSLLLRTCGWEVRALAGRDELLGAHAEAKPACIVLDLRWPDRSGQALSHGLTRFGPGIPVIAITAFDDALLTRQALKGGASQVLAQPVRADELIQAISRAVAAAASAPETART